MKPATATFDPSYFRAQKWWRDETLRDWLARPAKASPHQSALRTVDGLITYAQLGHRVRALAAGLQKLGIGRGDVVAVHLPNIPEFIVSWLAINELGAVMQTVHMPYGSRELEHLLGHSGARTCVALGRGKDRSPAEDIHKLRGKLPALRHIISVRSEAPGCERFEAAAAHDAGPAFKLPPVSAGDDFMLLYTSGTTSSPKAVSVTYNHFLSNARMCAAEFGITANDRILCLAPYTHLYGLYTLELGFSAAATACLLDVFTPGRLRAGVVGHEADHAVCRRRPISHRACSSDMFDGVDFGAMRVAVLSGSTVPPALSAAFEALLPNGKVLQAWGMTELQFGACSRPSRCREIRFDTIGRATPGTELRVADPDGNVLPRAKSASCTCADARFFQAMSATPTRRARALPPTAGSAPAISPAWTRKATSSLTAAPRS